MYGKTVCKPDWLVTEPRATGYSRIYLIYSGTVSYTDSQKSVSLQRDHLYIFPSSKSYAIEHDPTDPLHCTFLHYDFFPVHISSLIDVAVAGHPVMHYLFAALAESIEEQNDFMCDSIVQVFVNYCREKQLIDPKQSPVAKAVDYIRHNYMVDLNNTELSGIMGYNPQYFIRLFRKHVGLSPHQYVINYRIQEARQLLKTDRSITEIAELCGFPDVKSFGRSFRNTLGISPSQFRVDTQQP